MTRPVLYVLAGVNGAGKSSIGGYLLERAGMSWFNPDTFARELMRAAGCDPQTANALAWEEGMRRLDAAIIRGQSHAFETTLGGNTVAQKILAAAKTHAVMVWFCGLDSPEHHLARVRARVAAGGHDIPEAKIRARYPLAQLNLIGLMPYLTHLQIYDNSLDAAPGEAIPDPILLLEMSAGRLITPATADAAALNHTPEWAKALVEAALDFSLSGN
ncbi:MAG: zeta toxin family protein [Zoogloeaceae bacterium]|jgi:predicted ABC-type ATPase|nr:zeta toxin family protein [Zoogloeaceae bacterium]